MTAGAFSSEAACKTACADKDGKTGDKATHTVEVAKKHSCPMEKFEAESTKLAATLAHAFKNGDAKAFVAALPENLRKDFDEKEMRARAADAEYLKEKAEKRKNKKKKGKK